MILSMAVSDNVFAIPLAAGVLYPFASWRLPPAFAGLMMAFSSVCVVTSSLLLRAYVKPVVSEDGVVQGGVSKNFLGRSLERIIQTLCVRFSPSANVEFHSVGQNTTGTSFEVEGGVDPRVFKGGFS